ncbi:gastrula zinc finger protein XlCGF7.1-like [Ctenocephalides felis]|uniref:gastrula zinc finger protein XlCGF7.1-like n=1 Tax=Ctenocephalides felis TaxID=7515 RepID=UPI000E6E208F|nr:gastrula zinc finger protein XlCGF7.1-like [Ctenocephalides felis]
MAKSTEIINFAFEKTQVKQELIDPEDNAVNVKLEPYFDNEVYLKRFMESEVTIEEEIKHEYSEFETNNILNEIKQESVENENIFQPKEKLHKCGICKETFNLLDKIAKFYHTNCFRAAKKSLFKCTHCDKSFSTKNGLNCHIKYHATKTYKCETCNRTFANCISMHVHMAKIHARENQHICLICDKAYSTGEILKRHMNTHIEMRAFECMYCKKKFAIKRTFERHMQIHTGGPFYCKFCDKTFGDIQELKSHITVHTEERPYECKLCDKTYTGLYGLKKHMKLHSKEKLLKCTFCSDTFLEKDEFGKHIQEHL